MCKSTRTLGILANNNARRVQIIIQRLALTQKLRGKNNSIGIKALAQCLCKSNRNRGFNDNSGRITHPQYVADHRDRKSTRLNSSHVAISYAVFCLKKKNISCINMQME